MEPKFLPSNGDLDVTESAPVYPQIPPLCSPCMPNGPERICEIASFMKQHAAIGDHFTFERVASGRQETGRIFKFYTDGFGAILIDPTSHLKRIISYSGVASVIALTPDENPLSFWRDGSLVDRDMLAKFSHFDDGTLVSLDIEDGSKVIVQLVIDDDISGSDAFIGFSDPEGHAVDLHNRVEGFTEILTEEELLALKTQVQLKKRVEKQLVFENIEQVLLFAHGKPDVEVSLHNKQTLRGGLLYKQGAGVVLNTQMELRRCFTLNEVKRVSVY